MSKAEADWRPLTSAELAGPVTRKNFWRRAYHHGKHVLRLAADEWPTIAPGTDEWKAWKAYFQRKGWIPAKMQELETYHRSSTGTKGLQLFTVPTPHPAQFDPAGCDPEPAGYYARAAGLADRVARLDTEPLPEEH